MKDDINGWYYMQLNWRGHSFVRGPLSVGELLNLLEKGEISGKTQVRCDSTSFWQPLNDVLPLITILAKRTDSKTAHVTFLTFRKGHKVALFIVLAVIGFIIVGKYVSEGNSTDARSRVSHGYAGMSMERKYPGQEILSREAVARLTNRERTVNGLEPLGENQLLNTIAEDRAKDMLEKQYFAHVSPTGEQASDLAQRVGYRYKIIAENIASGMFLTNQKIVDGWMQSPGHRKNILSPEVREIGVSVMKGRMSGQDTWVSVQIFGLQSLPVSTRSCTHPPQDLLNQINAKKAELGGLKERFDNLRKELDSEKTTIELDQMLAKKDSKGNHDLNVKIKTYNEKSRWHNESLAEIKAKEAVLNSMIEEYNRKLQNYKNCQTSG
jgi:uncharacterized protein YkwD